jgi:hypothetical protein
VVLAVFPAASAAVTVRRPFPPASVVRPRNAHDANVVVRGTTIGQRDTTSSLDWQHRLQAGFLESRDGFRFTAYTHVSAGGRSAQSRGPRIEHGSRQGCAAFFGGRNLRETPSELIESPRL